MGQEPTKTFRNVAEEPVGFWSFDIASGLSFMDPAVSRLFGINPLDGVRGLGCERFIERIHPDDRAVAIRETERVLQHHDLFSWYYRLQTLDGTVESVHATGRCFQDADGKPTHLAGILARVEMPEPKPIELEVIEGLVHVRDLAKLTPDPMLPRLIDAVLLHAGRELAKGLSGPDQLVRSLPQEPQP